MRARKIVPPSMIRVLFFCWRCTFALRLSYFLSCFACFFALRSAFMDIPDVLSGEMELTLEPPTVPLHIAEPTETGPVAPAKGNYVVSSDEGVYLRENATTESTRLAALQKGTQLSIGAFKYDAANESFWGRTSADGMYGWVIMSALSPVETQEPTAAAAADRATTISGSSKYASTTATAVPTMAVTVSPVA